MVYTAVQPENGEAHVVISIPARDVPEGAKPLLHWGVFRSDTTWHHPHEVVPPGSWRDDGTGAMRTPLYHDQSDDAWRVELRVPRGLQPLQLGFLLYMPELNRFEGSRAGRHFCIPVGMSAGSPRPLGPTLVGRPAEDGSVTMNFAVFSRHASSMSLCLVRRSGSGYLEVVLDPAVNRSGDVWHLAVGGLKDVGSLCYGWRAGGQLEWAEGGCFHPGYIMLDPYCPRAVRLQLPQAAYDAAPLLPPEGALKAPSLLGSLAHLVEEFDWQGVARPNITLEDTVLFELDVPSFTTGPAAERVVPPDHRGTYLGVIPRLPEIQALGATTIVLGSVFLSAAASAGAATGAVGGDADADGAANGTAAGPGGRRPLSFLAPEVGFAAGDASAAAGQLKQLVQAAHSAGLEVLLEAEFCLTAESAGGPGGRLQSMAGLDGDMYVRGGGGAGASGVLNTGQPVVRALVLEALRRWALEFQVDGFVLVNAENLTQDPHGAVMDSPPLVEDIAADPVLRSVKVFAAVGNTQLLPRSGERGFPHYGQLGEWNGRFTANVLGLLRDNAGGLHSALATRITGSPDLFDARSDGSVPGGLAVVRRPGFGVNAALPPGGGSLLAALGSDADLERTQVVARSVLLAIAVSQGTPAFNSATCENKALARFIAGVLQVRAAYRLLLAPPRFDSPRDIRWHGAAQGSEPDWTGGGAAAMLPGCNYIAFSVRDGVARKAVYVGFNPHTEPTPVSLPPPPPGLQWRRVVDTSRVPPQDIVMDSQELLHDEYILAPGAALLLDGVPPPRRPAPGAAATGRAASSPAAAAARVYQRMGGSTPPPGAGPGY